MTSWAGSKRTPSNEPTIRVAERNKEIGTKLKAEADQLRQQLDKLGE
jgi:hypothetical protein